MVGNIIEVEESALSAICSGVLTLAIDWFEPGFSESISDPNTSMFIAWALCADYNVSVAI